MASLNTAFLFGGEGEMDFPGHEEAIGILTRAATELSNLGYEVAFVKSFSKEECLPVYSNKHFSLKITAGKWEKDSLAVKIPEDAQG
jgi:hypothetical protein